MQNPLLPKTPGSGYRPFEGLSPRRGRVGRDTGGTPAAAKARGVRFGAPGKPLPPGFAEVQRAYLEGSISLKTALGQTGMSPSTFCRKVKGLPLAGGHREREKGREGGKK